MSSSRGRSLRALGVDLGSKRIGLATCDAGGRLASPYDVIPASRDHAQVHRRLAAIVAEEEVEVVVVGYPLSLDGSRGPAARAAEVRASALAAVLDVPVVLHDERLTTVTAHQLLAAQGLDSRARRKVVDRAAAAVLLQTWLDGGSPMSLVADPSGPPEE
ncbi:Holliday junction resolvase RuvX [soil metagenome]